MRGWLPALAPAVLGVLLGGTATAQPALQRGTVVVLPFENPRGDPRLPWMREGIALLLGDVLAAHGVAVIERDERVVAFDRLQLPVAAVLSRASAIRVGQALGAAAVVVGRVEPETGGLVITAQVVQLDEGRLVPPVVERGPTPGVFDTWPGWARRWPGAGSTSPGRRRRRSGRSRSTEGAHGGDAGQARAALEEAVRMAPDYDAARLALWQVHADQGEHARALAQARAVVDGSHLSREARFLAGISLTRLRRLDEAFALLEALQKDSALPEVANALGVVQLRRGATPQTGDATYYFNLATELAPGEADFFFNLGYAYWLAGDANGAAYWLREAVRRGPADGTRTSCCRRPCGRWGRRRRRPVSGNWPAGCRRHAPTAAGAAPAVPSGLERLRDRLGAAARASIPAWSPPASATRPRSPTFTSTPPGGRRPPRRPRGASRGPAGHLSLTLPGRGAPAGGRLHQRAGRIDEAVQAFKIAVWSEETVPALVALAEACLELPDVAAARSAVERALAIDPRAPAALALRARLAQRR